MKKVLCNLLSGDDGPKEHTQLLGQTHLLPSLSAISLCYPGQCSVPDRPEQAQGRLASSLSAKVRTEGPNRAHCVLGGVLGGLGTQRSMS